MDRFDVAIVGAGPAGCRAAFRMAGAGARVAILDGTHPREKPCGGGVTGRALDLVRDAVDARRIATVPIDTATFEHSAGIHPTAHNTRGGDPGMARMSITGALTDPPRLVIASRRDFDAALLAAAVGAGARLLAARVTNVTRDGGAWIVATRDGTIRGDWLLGAD